MKRSIRNSSLRRGYRMTCFRALSSSLLMMTGMSVAGAGALAEPVREHEALPAALSLAAIRSMAGEAGSAYQVDANGRAINLRHGFAVTFTSRGALVHGRGTAFALRLERFGRGHGKPVRRGMPRIDGAWVEYDRGAGLREWFVNVPRGIEQGWTVTERPVGNGPLALELDIGRPPDQVDDGRLSWSGLRYHRLVAVDADGRVLPTRLMLHTDARLRIEIDDAAARYPVLIDPWLQNAKLTASDGGEWDAFGGAVAVWGDTAVLGATGAEVDGHFFQGAVYVFTWSDGVWSEVAKLTASDGQTDDAFGSSVALFEDTILVGVPRTEAVYVFTRTDGVWSEQVKLAAADPVGDEEFGYSVSLEGNTALVGAPGADVGDNIAQGAVYIFTGSGQSWSEQAKLTASDGAVADRFGAATALSGDTAVVGVWPFVDVLPGAAYVFTRDGDQWSEATKLTASDGMVEDDFGLSLALFDDTLVVGARSADVGETIDQGAAYVFTRTDGVWSEEAKLAASDGSTYDNFGGFDSVALSGDAAIIGAASVDLDDDGNSNHGAVYTFARRDGVWIEQTKLVASDAKASDNFGGAVALSGDVAVVGAPHADVDFKNIQGKAYVFVGLPSDFAVIKGHVRSLELCDAAHSALTGALVTVVGLNDSYTASTDEDGYYQIAVEAIESPVDIEVTASDHLPEVLQDVDFDDDDTVVQDFDLRLDAPCVTTDPAQISVVLEPGQSANETLTLGNIDGGAPLQWAIATAQPSLLAHRPAGREASGGGGAVRGESSDNATRMRGVASEDGRDIASLLGGTLSSVRPIDPVQGVIDCEAEPGILIHDDGTIENAYSGNPDTVSEVIFADRFTPGVYPASLRAVCVALVRVAGAPVSMDFEIVVFDDDGPSGSPGTELGSLMATATDLPTWPVTVPTWESFEISSLDITIDSGSVYVGVRWTPSDSDIFLAADQSPSRPVGVAGGYWWNDNSGTWGPIQNDPSFWYYRSTFVRAVEGDAGCHDPTKVSWLGVAPEEGAVPSGAASAVQVSFDVSGLAPGVYRASLCIANNSPVSPMVVPVKLTVTDKARTELTFDPSTLNFGDIEIGITSPPQIAMLRNTGDFDAAGLDRSVLAEGFVADTRACGDSLPAGESCPIEITLTPVKLGPVDEILRMSSADGVSASLNLTGDGVSPGRFSPTTLRADPVPTLDSDGNGVYEAGEYGVIEPTWRNAGSEPQILDAIAGPFFGPQGPDGPYYSVADDYASYGLVNPGQTKSCRQHNNCYGISVTEPAARPSSHWDATLVETITEGTAKAWTLHLGDSFADVARTNLFYRWIETLLHHAVTGGCTATAYCPSEANTRAQMSVFLLKAVEGGDYMPPACAEGAERFPDVPFNSLFCGWIEELATRGITTGCGGGNYCPGKEVSRGQMAVFLLRTLVGPEYVPPPCDGVFVDVPCPSLFANWIEDLVDREIAAGCGGDNYCPDDAVSRGQMSVFLSRTAGLELYGP